MNRLLALRKAGYRPPVARGRVVRHGRCCYSVPSYTVPGKEYAVLCTGGSWICTCLWHCYGRVDCKHIRAARAAFGPRAPGPEPGPTVIPDIEPGTCPKCGSVNSKTDGVRKNKNYRNQKYRCLDCGRHFSANAGLGDTVIPPELVPRVMAMASSGMPYAKIAEFLATCNVRVCVKTVCNIVRRFSKILIWYCGRLRPAVYELWRTDEKRVVVAGGKLYLHGLMDDATRLLLSVQLTPRKAEDDVSLMYSAGADWAGKIPHLLVSDGAPSFHAAWESCYRPNRKNQKYTYHAAVIHIDGNMNNNMMESLNRELGRRMWPARFVSAEAAAAMAERVRLFYNFFHKHSGLGGKTPAEAAGIVVQGNRWMTLLRNAHASKVR